MTDIVIRQLAGEEMLEAMYSLTSYALHASPPLTNQDEWNEMMACPPRAPRPRL